MSKRAELTKAPGSRSQTTLAAHRKRSRDIQSRAILETIEQKLKQIGVSKEELTRKASVSRTFFQNMKGGAAPNIITVQSIAHALGITVAELLKEEPPPQPPSTALSKWLTRSEARGLSRAERVMLASIVVEDGPLDPDFYTAVLMNYRSARKI